MSDPLETKIDSVNIRVEKLTPYTFHSWTDGSKCVIDTVGALRLSDLPNEVRILRARLGDGMMFIRAFPEVTTFYVVAELGEVVELVNKFPTRDIRKLEV